MSVDPEVEGGEKSALDLSEDAGAEADLGDAARGSGGAAGFPELDYRSVAAEDGS